MTRPENEVERLLAAGGEQSADGREEAALHYYLAAWDVLPEPKAEQGQAIEVLAAIADASFQLRQWEECRRAVQQSFRCGADADELFLRLRLGESLYELGEEREAAEWLVPLYRAHGAGPFEGEDPKYLQWVRSRLDAPPGE